METLGLPLEVASIGELPEARSAAGASSNASPVDAYHPQAAAPLASASSGSRTFVGNNSKSPGRQRPGSAGRSKASSVYAPKGEPKPSTSIA